jgi:S1-C subfamily serine protease
MKNTLLALSVIFGCLLATPAFAWDIADMNAQIDQTNFMVNDGCSGTLIDKTRGLVLTANHCVAAQYEDIDKENVDDKGKITKEKVRRLRDGTVSQLDFQSGDAVRTVVYKVKVLAVDADVDLALLEIKAKIPNTQETHLACVAPVRGDTAYVVGNPMGSLYSSVVKGIVSSVQRNYDLLKFGTDTQIKQPLMQVSSGVIGGNSGGAAYNSKGELIGVPVLGHRTNEILGFAVPLDVVRSFLIEHDAKDIAAITHCDKP